MATRKEEKAEGKALLAAMNDIRKARRDITLREEKDPAVVAETLERILKEAIALRSSGSGFFGKGAERELNQVRKALVAEQIDAGNRTIEFQGKFATVLEQIQKIDTEGDQSKGFDTNKQIRAIKDNLPSAETITSAIMTGNPILGYTLKIGRDLLSSRKEIKARNAEFEKERLSQLKEQEAFLLEQIKTEEVQQENVKAEKKEREKPAQRRSGIYEPALKEIRDEIHYLNEKLGLPVDPKTDTIDNNNDKTESLVMEQTEKENEFLEKVTSENTEKLEKVSNETNEKLERIAAVEAERLQLEKDKDMNSGLKSRESDFESTAKDKVNNILGSQGKDKGGFPLLLGSLGGLLGGLTAAAVAGLVGLVGFLKKAGKMVMKFGKFTGVLAVVVGLVNFVDGFLSAGDILQKDPNAVGIKDRILVGVSKLLSSILGPIEWLVEKLTGGKLDLFSKTGDDLTRQIFYALDELPEKIVDYAVNLYEDVVDSILEVFNLIRDKIMGFYEDTKDFIKETPGKLFDMGSDAFESFKDRFTDDEGKNSSSRNTRGGMDALREEQQQSKRRADLQEYADRSINRTLIEKMDANERQGMNNSGNNTIIAPSTSSTNVMNNNQILPGEMSSSNTEPSSRRNGRMSRGRF